MRNVPDWLQVILKIGLPGAIAVFLVYRLAGGFDIVDVRLKAIETQHAQMLNAGERLQDAVGRAALSSDRVLLVLRQICVQNANSAADRRDCLREP